MDGPAVPPAVLVTRPREGAEEAGQRLLALGFRPVFAPLLRIVPRREPVPVPPGIRAVALTSANAVSAIPPSLRALPVFTVSAATADAARRAGCTTVRSAGGNSRNLADLLLSAQPGPVLLLSGAGQGAPLLALLRAGGLAVARRTAYAARPVAALPRPVLALLAGPGVHAVVLMSAATAARFAAVLPPSLAPSLANTVAACVSEPAAAPVRHLPWRHLRVPLHPTLSDTLALL